MHARVIEVVALQPPRVGEDLPPLGHRVNRRLEAAGVDLLVQLLPLLGLDDGVVAALLHQQLLAVGGQLHGIRVLEHGLLLALLQIVEDHRLLLLGRAEVRQAVEEQLA